jgi:hypothetical protein
MRSQRPVAATVFFVSILFVANLHGMPSGHSNRRGLPIAIRDEQGYPIVGAMITATTKTGTKQQCMTGNNGQCSIRLLPTDLADIVVDCVGFKEASKNGIKVTDRKVAVVLKINTAETSVIVEGRVHDVAPAAIGEIKGAEQIENLPVWLRDLNNLVLLTPGVVGPSTDDDQGQGVSGYGSRTTFTNYVMDGISDRDERRGGPSITPILEAVADVQVLTSSYSPEYGHTTGVQVILSTKSGSDSFHGKIFDYALYQTGAVLGGPIVRGKAYFFGSVERATTPEGDSQVESVPSAAWLNGNFSSVKGGIRVPSFSTNASGKETFTQFTVIPSKMISPLAKQLVGLIPTASGNGKTITENDNSADSNQGLVRLDYSVASNAKLFTRFGYQSTTFAVDPDTDYEYIKYWPREDDISRSAVIGFQQAFQRTILQAHAGVNTGHGVYRSRCTWSSNYAVRLDGYEGAGCPAIQITGLPLFGDVSSGYSYDEETKFGDLQMSVRRGRALFKLGLSVAWVNFIQPSLAQRNGVLSFTGQYSGNAVADFLLGFPNTASFSTGTRPNSLYRFESSYYVDMSTNVTRRFLLDVGVRFASTPGFESNGPASSFVPALGKLVTYNSAKQLFPDQPVMPEPRIGFSYHLSETNNVVLRGGAGVFTGDDAYMFLADQINNNPPYMFTQAFNPGSLQPNVAASNQWSTNGTAAIRGLSLTHPLNSVYGYNLAVEKSLGNGVLSMGYIGSQSRHLERRYNLNEFLPVGELNSKGAAVIARTYSDYGDIIIQDTGASSGYNAGQISWSSSKTGPIHFKLAYTFSRSIDDASSTNDTNWLTPQYPQDFRDLNAEKGLSDFQHKQQLMTYGVLDLHRMIQKRWMANSNLGFSMIAMSGIPFTPEIGAYRPDMISNPFKNVPAGHYFNPAAFVEHKPTVQDPSYFGDLGRNALIGPGSCEVNTSFDRSFHFSSSTLLKIRAELFNALNKRVGFPNWDLTSATAGEFRHYQNNPRYFVAGADFEF